MSKAAAALSEDEKDEIRREATKVLNGLAQEAAASSTDAAPSWIQSGLETERSETCRYFDFTGFRHVPAFCDPTSCTAMKQQMADLVERWQPENIDSFGTNDAENTARADYFLESADRVHCFAEPVALDDQKRLKPEYVDHKLAALNKAGHGLHCVGGAFCAYTRSHKLRRLVLDLGWQDPVVPQSMYIFKQAGIGGVVNSHQDSTFLFTTPKQSCLGLWLALDEATLDNGCLWVRPKSHRESVRRQYKRNPEHFGNGAIERRSNVAQGDLSKPKFVMTQLSTDDDIPSDGSVPENGWKGMLEAGFVPIECQGGDLLVFAGELDHLSLPNTSDKPRHTFQLHLVEGPRPASLGHLVTGFNIQETSALFGCWTTKDKM